MATSSVKAKKICQTLGKPSEANARVLANLFPTCASSGTKQHLNFNPNDECVAGEAHCRKKAATPGQGRAKKLKVVLLSSIPSSIPKGSRHENLNKNGQVVEIPFHHSITASDVMRQIRRAFGGLGDINNIQFLQARQDNTLHVAENQHGVGVIKLAGCGSLYAKQSERSDTVVIHDGESEESNEFPCTSKPRTVEPIESTKGSQSSSIASKPRTVESNESIDGRVAAALEQSEQIVQQ